MTTILLCRAILNSAVAGPTGLTPTLRVTRKRASHDGPSLSHFVGEGFWVLGALGVRNREPASHMCDAGTFAYRRVQ